MLDVIVESLIAISFLMMFPILRLAVLCTGDKEMKKTLNIHRVHLNLRVLKLCILFILSDGVDEYVVNKLLCQIFSDSTNSAGKICSLVKESASRKFDMKEEVLFLSF